MHYWEGAPPSGGDRPIVLNPKSHPGILIEVILIKQKACNPIPKEISSRFDESKERSIISRAVNLRVISMIKVLTNTGRVNLICFLEKKVFLKTLQTYILYS